MYKAFYGLKSLPFQIDTDPTFLWLGEKHREAISMLRYGIQTESHTGLLLLTGDVGTGKTTLINALFNSLKKGVIRAAVSTPSMEELDFLNYVAASFGSKKEFKTKGRFLIAFERFLKNANSKNRKVLLVVDEAQLLSDSLLEQIRLFSNIESNGRSLIKTFLVGQNELRGKLVQPSNRALKQRVTLNYNIDALVFEETEEYIKYRLQVAGTAAAIFDKGAVQLIHQFSRGLPRKINIICDHALLTGFVKNLKTINSQIIRECINEISISGIPQIRDDDTQKFDALAEQPHLQQPSPPTEAPDINTDIRKGNPPVQASRKELNGNPSHIASDKASTPKSKKPLLFFLAICLMLGMAAGYFFLLS